MGNPVGELNELYKEVLSDLLSNKSPYMDVMYNKKCLICGKSGKFCKSHSIPKSKMSDMQIYYNVNYFLIDKQEYSYPSDKSSSVKTGIFKNICNTCDSNAFRSYENFIFEGNLEQMRELHLKSQLLFDYTKAQQYSFSNAIKSKYPMYYNTIFESELENSKRDFDCSKEKIELILNNQYHYKMMFDIDCKLDIGIFCNISFTPFADMKNLEINDKYIQDKSSLNDVECITFAYYDIEKRRQRIICIIASIDESRIHDNINIHINANKNEIQKYISYMLLYTNNIYFDNAQKIKKNNVNEIFNSYLPEKTLACYNSSSQMVKDFVRKQNLGKHKEALNMCYKTRIFK